MLAENPTADYTRQFGKVCEILDKYERKSSKLIPILQAIQHEYRYLPEDVLTYVATSLNLSPANVYGVATFYSHFALEPKGLYVVKVCDGTACHVKGSGRLVDTIEDKLGLDEKRRTTADMLFTLETVSCLGACGLAPVVVINEDVHGQVNDEKVISLIDDIIAKEKGGKNGN